jgi:hypothetical protein
MASGGTITADIFSFPGGRRFPFADPAGNVLLYGTSKRPFTLVKISGKLINFAARLQRASTLHF